MYDSRSKAASCLRYQPVHLRLVFFEKLQKSPGRVRQRPPGPLDDPVTDRKLEVRHLENRDLAQFHFVVDPTPADGADAESFGDGDLDRFVTRDFHGDLDVEPTIVEEAAHE